MPKQKRKNEIERWVDSMCITSNVRKEQTYKAINTNYCRYCNSLIKERYWRHMERKRKNEMEIKHIMKLPDKERKIEIKIIKIESNKAAGLDHLYPFMKKRRG